MKEKEDKSHAENNEMVNPTVFIERESFLTILTERDRFFLSSKGGGNSSPSIASLRLLA